MTTNTSREHSQLEKAMYRTWRKFGSMGLDVSANIIAGIESGKGVVVQTVRDSKTGQLLLDQRFDLADVKEKAVFARSVGRHAGS